MRDKKRKKIITIVIAVMLVAFFGLIIFLNINDANKLNADRIMEDGTYQIRFSDLVSLESLEQYNNKTVTAVGYLSPIMSYDGSFGYLMNLPYQTCPYCDPSDTRITNTLTIFAKEGEKLEFTESAVVVRGTLKLEQYTDLYGYSYNYRLTDVTIEIADTSAVSEKITLYNEIADKQILAGIMDTLYVVDNNVFYDEYTANGAQYERSIVEIETINQVIENLKSFNQNDVKTLVSVSNKLKEIAVNTNKLIEAGNYDGLSEYKGSVYSLYYSINSWMAEYQL